jgi:cell division protein FtsW
MVVVLLFGSETKGAQRWLNILGISLQPSEFVKPFFAVCAAGLLAQTGGRYTWKEMRFSLLLYGLIILLLILQPDFGMALTISVIWGGQLFIAGLPMVLVISMMFIGFIGMIAAYHFLPHVTYRVNSFLGTDSETTYQVKKSIEAFQHGGLFGRGPGEGTVKQHLPDSHTDFIFAVAGEELGALVCMLLVVLYAIIVLRGLYRLQEQRDLFLVYSIAGLLIIIGAQAVVNMGVALHLFPTKGMTLPFISYGGSSMLSISIAMGMIFALTRRRYGKILKRGPGI